MRGEKGKRRKKEKERMRRKRDGRKRESAEEEEKRKEKESGKDPTSAQNMFKILCLRLTRSFDSFEFYECMCSLAQSQVTWSK